MQDDTPLTDDYMAELLARDARAVSARTTSGLGIFGKGHGSSGTAPKLNTRFLRNVIRDVDSHNASLWEKEAQESRARLRALEPEQRRGRRQEQQVYSVRARREGVTREEPAVKRRRVEEREEDRSTRRRHRSRSPEPGNDLRHRREKDGERTKTRDIRGSDQARHRRSRSPHGLVSDRERQRHRRRRDREGPRSRHHERSELSSTEARGPSKESGHSRLGGDKDNASDSDTSQSLGPRRASTSPPLRTRGRGLDTATRSMDTHFQKSYDPSSDVRLSDDDERDDWDQALEALRDRQKWKQKGAERLKAAGFSDAEVKNWEGSGDGNEGDVKWKERGEAREWDRGKEVD